MKMRKSKGVRYSNRTLHDSLLDLMGAINSPQSDAKLLQRAGVCLDRGLYPLLVRIARRPIPVTKLAEQVGRDQSTVSRQLQGLEQLGLISRALGTADQRMRNVEVTGTGRKAVARIAAAREQLTDEALSGWGVGDRITLAELMRRLADSVLASMKRP
jgi:DNA-binding MarR family transcriptional regulator